MIISSSNLLQQHRNTASAHHALFLGIVSVHAHIHQAAFELLLAKQSPAMAYNLCLRTTAAYSSDDPIV